MIAADLEEIYHSTKLEVFRYLVSLCGDQDQAQDLLHGVFLKLMEALQKRDIPRAEIRPYLFRAAYNHFVDSYRKSGTEKKTLERLKYEQPAASEFKPLPRDDHQAMGRRIRAIVGDALNGHELTERQKDIARLRLLANAGMDDITASLDVSRSTAYRELERALIVLREKLKEAGLTLEELSEH